MAVPQSVGMVVVVSAYTETNSVEEVLAHQALKTHNSNKINLDNTQTGN